MMPIIPVILLSALFLIAGYIIWTWPNPRYKHPKQALGVGPVWTKEQDPPLHYMWVWKDGDRLKMEFRNLPGIVIACYWGVAGELSESIKKLVDVEQTFGE